MSSTYVYDDGSTITRNDDGSTYATESPTGYLASDYYKNFTPSNVSPGASSWLDVLKFGIGRVADYKTATLAPQNTPATYAPQVMPQYVGGGGFNASTLMLLGGAVLVFVVVSSLTKKKG